MAVKVEWNLNDPVLDYTTKNWREGEIIYAGELDRIENGILDNRLYLKKLAQETLTKITTIEDNIGLDEDNNTGISSRVSTLEASISTLQTNVNNINGNITILTNKIGNTNYNGDTITAAIASLQSVVEDFNLEQLQDDINTYVEGQISSINRQVNDILNDVNQAKIDAQQAAANATTNAQTAAQAVVNNLVTNIYGSGGVNNEGNNSLKEWISSQLTALNTSVNQAIAPSITALQGVDSRIEKALGATYYNITNSSWDLSDNVKSVDTRISEIYNAVFGNSSSGSNKTIIEQIADLNEYLGLTAQATGSSSLIDKIENALGRPLEPTAAEILENPQLNESLLTLITQIQAVLGMNGETSQEQSSSLITLVNQLSTAIYGNTTPTANDIAKITEPLSELANDFYNLTVKDNHNVSDTFSMTELLQTMYPTLKEVEEVNTTLDQQIKDFSSAAERVSNSYIDASPEVIGENNYLVLKRDTQANIAQNETDITDNEYLNNTYIILPKGGGGGGTTYSYYSVFEVDRSDTSLTVTQDDSYIIKYKWITRDSVSNEDSSGITGTLRLYNNEVLVYTTSIVSKDSTPVGTTPDYLELQVSEYIHLGTNVFKVVVTSNDTASKNFYYTIECINPVLISTFDPSNIQTGNTILYQFTMSIGNSSINKTLHLAIDGTELQNISSYSATSERIQTVTFSTPSNGSHLLEAWFTININNKVISSNVLRYGIICGILNQIYISTDLKPNTQIEQYNNLIVNYLARTPNQNTTHVLFSITNLDSSAAEENELITYAHRDEIVDTNYNRYTYQLNIPLGENETSKTLYFNIQVSGRDDTRTSIPFVLLKNERYNFSPVTTGLKLYLTADQHSNTASDKEIWTNSSTASERVDVSATLSNFLFYKNVDGWQQDSDNKYFLRLRNKARVEIPFSVFDFTRNGDNITDGMTFEIEFKTNDVLNYDTICVACCEASEINNSTISRGIILTPQNSRFQVATTSETISSDDQNVEVLTATNVLNAYYKEEEKMTIAFVVNKTIANIEQGDNPNEAALMYIYINGILSGATPYTSFNNFTNGKIIIGSDKCTTDIYSIRCYSRPLDYKDIIQNWISNEGNIDVRTALYNKNTYTHTNDTELFEQFKLNSPETPYMVISAAGDLNNNAVMPIQKGSENKHTVDFYFVDPLVTSNNIGAFSSTGTALSEARQIYGEGKMEIQVQGTSSQYYYRKNYKLKFSSFTQDGIKHIKKPADTDYDITYDENNNEIKTLKSGISKEGYKLSSTSYPTWSFCIKADVASSESANNTRLTMLYDEYSRNYYQTPPQEQDASIRQGVEGRPVVVWYYNADPNISSNRYTLLGKYNFNNDKGTHEVFGLEGDEHEPWAYDQSWEVKNNGNSPLTLFNYTDNNWATWYDGFEARFPDQDDTATALSGNKAITGVSAEEQAKWTAGLKEVVKWVSDTVQLTTASNGHDSEATDDCIAAFKEDFPKYFNLDAMLFFYVFTEFFLMVDNRAKNMFLTRYLITDDRDSSYGINQLTKDGTNSGNYFGWFSFPYDFDTAIGIDNNGRIRFDYHYESFDLQPDGISVVFNGQRSKLWKAFEKAYASEIADMYQRFGSRINYEYVENLFEQHQSVWSAAIFNEDMIHKYIDWGNAYLYMLLGSKESHRKWWLFNRFRYFNSKYQVDKNSDRIYLRVAPGNYNLTLSTYADSYINIEIGANGTPNTVRALRGTPQTLQYTANEQDSTQSQTGIDGIETIIYPASALNTLNGIAALAINEADFSMANKLETLKLGSPTIINSKLKNLTLGQNNTTLRHFDMRNYSAYSAQLDLSNYISLETVYLSGTAMNSVILPSGGILSTVQYPITTTYIRIENQPYLTNLIIGNRLPSNERDQEDIDANVPIYSNDSTNDYSNINSLYLDNVGIINETTHTNSIDSAKIISQMVSGGRLYLNNFVWSMTVDDFKDVFDKIITMHSFESEEEKPYVSGTLYLTGDFPTGFSIEDINSQFEGRVKVYHNGYEYNTIKYYGLNNDLLLTQLVAGSTANPYSSLFTEEYIVRYNTEILGWHDGDDTRQGFGGWEENINFNNITQDWELHARPITQVKLNYIMLTENIGATVEAHKYYNLGQVVSQYYDNQATFIRDYYLYRHDYWTLDGTDYTTLPPEDKTREPVNNFIINTTTPATFYAVYSKDNAKYTIRVFNTDINGEPVSEPIKTITNKTVIHTDDDTHLLKLNELNDCNPLVNQSIYIDGYSADANKADSNRMYRFLNWRPYLDENNPLAVTGDMDIYITYYYVDDIFTNYFLNKIVNETITEITNLPEGAFFHSTNLRKINLPDIQNLGKFSFCNQNTTERKIYILGKSGNNNDIVLNEYAFSYLRNAIIIFRTSGTVYVYNNSFSNAQDCILLLPDTNEPIKMYNRSQNDCFQNFIGSSYRNQIFVTSTAYSKYINTTSTDGIPNNFKVNNRTETIFNGNTEQTSVTSILEEANLDDIKFN